MGAPEYQEDGLDPAETRRSVYAAQSIGLIARLVLPALVGVGLGYLLLVTVVLPRIDLGRVQRIVEIAHHLESNEPRRPWAVVLGDSVAGEGIDAEIVELGAGQYINVNNYSVGGFDLNEARVMLPRLLAASPEAIVLTLTPSSASTLRYMPADKAYAYSLAGFVGHWPDDWVESDFEVIGNEAYLGLRSSRFEQYLHFRGVLVNSFDHNLRKRMRSDLRTEFVSDFKRPFEYLSSISGQVLQGHLTEMRHTNRRCVPGEDDRPLVRYQEVIELIAAGGAMPVVAMLSIHPELQEQVFPFLDYVEAFLLPTLSQNGGVLIDFRRLLNASEFADAVHPNADGRAVLSRAIGERLPIL